MLWRRTWLETRTRFILAAVTMSVLTVLGVFLFQGFHSDNPAKPFPAYVWELLYRRGLVLTWPILALVLGTIGIASENTCRWKRQGVAGMQHYLLTLPLSRRALLSARCGVVLAQVFAIAILQPLLLVLLGLFIGQTYPLIELVEIMLLLAGSGAACASFGLLLSLMFGSETTAIIVGYCVLFSVNFYLFFARQFLQTPPALLPVAALCLSGLLLGALQVFQAMQVLAKKDY